MCVQGMPQLDRIRTFIGACAVLLIVSAAHAAERPNIVVIMGDDVGWGDIRANNPNGKVALPTLERLSAEGIRFTNAHTSAAKCEPSRYAMITGNYQWRGRLSWNFGHYTGGSEILPGQETLGQLVKRAGYATAYVGKWHLSANFYALGSDEFASSSLPDTSVDFSREMADGPREQGFDYSFVAMEGIQASPYAFFENDSLVGDPSQLVMWEVGNYGDTKIVKRGIGLPNWNTRNVGPTLMTKATDFIESHHSSQDPNPFLLFLSTESVHVPNKPPAAINDRLIGGTTRLSARADMLVEIDVIVDNIQRKLQQVGELDNTLIIFTSDNGANRLDVEEQAGHVSTGGFRGQKGTIYEGGHRVPLIMKWGTQAFGGSPLPQGTVIDALVGTQDLYATLADLIGIASSSDQGRDSFSLLPLLMGEASVARGQIVHEGDENENGVEGLPYFGYRSGPWKLILDVAGQPAGLFNLDVDPYETTDLRSQPDKISRVAAMKAGLDSALGSVRTAPSIGAPLVSVPGLTGLAQLDAESAIESAQLNIGTVVGLNSQSVPAGNVIDQDPFGDTLVPAGSAVSLVVSLGAASTPQYSLAPASIAFGNQPLKLTSDLQNVTLDSTGQSELPITSISLSGTGAGQFSLSHDCGSSVPAGSACTLSVRFKPTSTGSKAADLTVVAGAGAGTQIVKLSGTGVRSVVSVAPASLAFGNQARGTTSATRAVTISNGGTVILPILSISITGTNPGQFSRNSTCPAQLPVAGQCVVNVAFKPTSKGVKTANLTIAPGGGAAKAAVSLNGNGT